MSRGPNLHRRLLWLFLVLPAAGEVIAGTAGVFGGAAAASMLLAVAYTRDFLLHAWQRRMGCLCNWSCSSELPRFVAHEGCPHHGGLWPHQRPRPPRNVLLKALSIVTGSVGALVLLMIALSTVLH